MNSVFLVLSAFVGAGLTIAGTWAWLGALSILVAPVGATVASVASAALLFSLRRSSFSSGRTSSVTPMQGQRPQQQSAASATNDDLAELKRSA